ncbi:alcohol dehydrogenase catalytic domain-containing protein [Coraliomargarita akajimensis]|uniref:Alcohol dehydrogenase zinc-binding domain protein n=1 Tax=Coraliomargarita akajimensis (strain DSM 45221 / IAM 15411 / JCM 23193 / KCTC 12865 / 04OKA010-24) TaxID=583355 RepID=D5EPT5_CORAD|nr:zinc-binding dehydrogenase [Coraliomargarita akajimensis]ADE55668.1 Alcohol dehydrogenase zinc-binding domain protein [Coraliomargarita akajimensis DSM 45221]
MRALCYDPRSGSFALRQIEQPRPEVGEVLIRVAACGLNPVDAKIAQWQGLVPRMHADWVPGLDVAGEIVELGAAVERWQIGDRVLCHGNMFRSHGGLAEYSVQVADSLVAAPETDATVAAAAPCAGWTAWRALVDRLNIAKRSSILIAGGSGGVGGFAVQIAAHFNVTRIIATCSAANREYVASLGATDVLDYCREDVVARVRELTGGQGVDCGLDTVGGRNDQLVADSLRFEGNMVELVQLVRPEAYRDAFMRGLGLHQLSLGSGHRNGPEAKEALVRAGRQFSELLEAGILRVPRIQVISLEEAGDALVQMLEQRTVGKIVVKLS